MRQITGAIPANILTTRLIGSVDGNLTKEQSTQLSAALSGSHDSPADIPGFTPEQNQEFKRSLEQIQTDVIIRTAEVMRENPVLAEMARSLKPVQHYSRCV